MKAIMRKLNKLTTKMISFKNKSKQKKIGKNRKNKDKSKKFCKKRKRKR